VKSWRIFIAERFPLASHLPMVAVFCAVNGGAALYGRAPELMTGTPANTAWLRAGLFTLLFFFRLRLFDEIKDYEVDLKINPTRPLARGLLTIPQVKRAIAVCVFLELVVLMPSGLAAIATWLPALTYSFLMYKEFFIGPIIRPRLTAYAMLHTAVSIGVGFTIGSIVTGTSFGQGLPDVLKWLGFVNWMFFNLFEFARKTYAPIEERKGVETYSSLFGPRGAWILSVSQVVAALLALSFSRLSEWMSDDALLVLYGVAAAWLISGLGYVFTPIPKTAGFYRGASGACIIFFYAVLAAHFLMRPAV